MSTHSAFLFSFDRYYDEIKDLVSAANVGCFSSLNDRVAQSIKHQSDDWPLRDLGDGRLPEVEGLALLNKPEPRNIGLAFRIILAEHLTPCVSPGLNSDLVYKGLVQLGWSERECKLLLQGKPAYQLLFPDESGIDDWPIMDDSPYWFWMHPHWAKAGWLSRNDVAALYKRMDKFVEPWKKIQIAEIEGITSDDPLIVKETLVYLKEGFTDTKAMLREALTAEMDIYMALMIYA